MLRNLDGVFAEAEVLLQIAFAFLCIVEQGLRFTMVRFSLLLDVRQTRKILVLNIFQTDRMGLLVSQQQHQLDADIALQLRTVELRIRLDLLADGVLDLLQNDGQIHHLHDVVAASRRQKIFQMFCVHDLSMAVEIVQQQSALLFNGQIEFTDVALQFLYFLVAFFTRHRKWILRRDGITQPPRLQVVLFLIFIGDFLLVVLNLFITFHARLAGDQLQSRFRQVLRTTAKKRLVFAGKNVFIVSHEFVHATPHIREFLRFDFGIQHGLRALGCTWRRSGSGRCGLHAHLLLRDDDGATDGLLNGGTSRRQEGHDNASIQKQRFMTT